MCAHRYSLAFLIAVGVALSLVDATIAQQSDKAKSSGGPTKSFGSYQHLEISRGDDELRRLMKQRFNTAVDELTARLFQYESGSGGLKTVQENASRVLGSGIELCDKPEEMTAFYAKHLELVTVLQAAVETQFAAGNASIADVANAKYYRLDAEIQLMKSKKK